MAKKINELAHPDYTAMSTEWYKFRLTYRGGTDFIEEYLEKYSARETVGDFADRKKITYCPAHAKAAINDIKNSIFQRTSDVTRKGGPSTFINATNGVDPAGVDLSGNTMNSYIGRKLLPELLTMAKVGVFVDRPDSPIETRKDQVATRPYIYYYIAEDIKSWAYDNENKLSTVLLLDHTYKYDDHGLPDDEIERYRLVWKDNEGKIKVEFYNDQGVQVDKDNNVSDITYELSIPEIPFVIFEITASLLTDVADYQRALLNLASSDLHYALKANFPFYTEQFNVNDIDNITRGPIQNQVPAQTTDPEAGTAADATLAKPQEAQVGPQRGRRYPKGMDRPGFINPSSEPLLASMQKQDALKNEIRQLVNLNLTNIEPRRASADSKAYDEKGLESGLSYIGLELEYGERQIAQFWANYEGSEVITTIKYPEQYSLKSDAERLDEADKLEKSASMSSSLTYKKEVAKEAADLRIGSKVSNDTIERIHADIEAAKQIVFDRDVLLQDQADGLVSPETASKLRGYAQDEVNKAADAHEKRLAAIAIAQAKGGGLGELGQARGVPDAGADPNESKAEKVGQQTRGESK